jgi:HAE1 family hydrophobic/amphiphilic exporter-1
MFALPLAMVGAFLGLLIAGHTLSIISFIGIIMLMGLVTKNGILVVDFTNQLRRQGMSTHEALLTAGPIRLRPILMTTFSTIGGMVPIVLGLGSGAEFRAPMASAVIGGLTTSTLLTLIVVPVVYALMDSLVNFIKRLFGRGAGKE